ncbi:MAG: TonB-dependent receptor [Bacteroidetes bacterium]|nr:MAG: TonB-dependent receptor [Bacteroidota bacterium]
MKLLSRLFIQWLPAQCVLLLLSGSTLSAQSPVTLSGYVRDQLTGEALIGATIFVPALNKGAYTNEYGFYSLTLPPGERLILYRYVGYKTDSLNTLLSASQTLNRELGPEERTLDAVEITSKSPGSNVQSTEMGVVALSMSEIKKVPVLFGETDILKTLQLMPGVKPAGEGNSGFFVRGGGTDQNLILLDEAPVYNASHLLGFFSVFNGDAINSSKLYKGNMPAEYGGRLSSALDIRMKEGNSKDFDVSGGLGLISSRLTLEGPIKENQGSFMVAGRRTYADLFLKLSPDSSLSQSQLYFYDLNAKANYKLGENNQIFLSGYLGRDVLGFQDRFGIDWGNKTATLRWNHLFSDKLFLNSTLIYSDYDYKIRFTAADATISSGIRDINWKEDISYYYSSQHTFKAGVNAIYHTFVPGVVTFAQAEDSSRSGGAQDRYGIESAAYLSHEWSPSDAFKLQYGLRASSFTVLGPGTFYEYNPEGSAIDSVSYGSGEIVKNYAGLEPRISATWILGEPHSVKASYARNRQYIHLISNSTAGTPTDVWLPSSENIAPEIADQVSLGYYRNFDDNRWEFSAEVYYKSLQNQIEYKNGADLLLNDQVESQLVFGTGTSYGAEFLLRKTQGDLTGWVGYTLSRTTRQFDEINEGNPFPARQDRTHDVSVVAIYTPGGGNWSFSGSWVYYTGDAVTFPSGSYVVDGRLVPYYTERNGYRLPDYHRLDLSTTWQYGKNPDNTLNVSLYNAYGRKNAYTIDFRESEENPGSLEAVKTYLFRWIPSLTWNFAF